MENVGELILQHPVDDAETHTLESATGAARTGSCEHDEQQDGHQLDRPQGVIDRGKSRRGLQGDDRKETLTDGRFHTNRSRLVEYESQCANERCPPHNDKISFQFRITEKPLHLPLENRIIY